MTFRASVFIATSLDGFIARPDGSIDWLTGAADGPADTGETGYDAFIAGIDAVVLGRGTYEKVLTFDAWPYGDRKVAVLSTTLAADADDRITVHRDLDELVRDLEAEHVYADGGRVIQSFLRAGLLHDLTITTVPVLIGEGIPLFGPLGGDVRLTWRSTRHLGHGYVQSSYTVGS